MDGAETKCCTHCINRGAVFEQNLSNIPLIRAAGKSQWSFTVVTRASSRNDWVLIRISSKSTIHFEKIATGSGGQLLLLVRLISLLAQQPLNHSGVSFDDGNVQSIFTVVFLNDDHRSSSSSTTNVLIDSLLDCKSGSTSEGNEITDIGPFVNVFRFHRETAYESDIHRLDLVRWQN